MNETFQKKTLIKEVKYKMHIQNRIINRRINIIISRKRICCSSCWSRQWWFMEGNGCGRTWLCAKRQPRMVRSVVHCTIKSLKPTNYKMIKTFILLF